MISICIITHKLDEKLRRTVSSVAGLGEIIIVDTRGEPPTVNFHGYYTYPWRENFAAARNFGLEKAKGKFLFSLDADEWIDGDGRRSLFKIGHESANRAYYTRLIDNGKYIMEQVKIFPNRSDIRYIGRVHEQIMPAIIDLGMPIEHSGINIYHDGYANPEELHWKRQRNLQIAYDWFCEEPNNIWAKYWYDYIRTYH